MADGLMNHDAWQTLRQKRIAVVDSAVPLEVVAKVRLWNGIWCFFCEWKGMEFWLPCPIGNNDTVHHGMCRCRWNSKLFARVE